MFTYNSTAKTYVRMLGKRTDDSTGRNRLERVEKGCLAMAGFIQRLRSRLVLRIVALATTGIAVSGCTYDVGLGYASDGYGYGGGSGYYDCDPYSPFDSYYDCDNGYGYSNIGYGGGWYDNLWYPGYGFFLFDNYGQRYNMRDNHRRYWGERRHRWYRENRGRHDGRTDARSWPERNGGRVRDGDSGQYGSWNGRRGRYDQWRGEEGNSASAVPTPNPEIVNGRGRSDGNGNRRRRADSGQSNPDWHGSGIGTAVPMPQPDGSISRPGRRGGRFIQVRPPANSDGQSGSVRQAPEPQSENPRLTTPPRGRDEPDRVPD